MSNNNIDSKLEDAILDAVGRYELEMVERFYTDGDPSLVNKGVWVAQVAAACDDMESQLRASIESIFSWVNNDLDEGAYMSSKEVRKELKTQERAREELHQLDSSPVAHDAPGIIPLVELCKTQG
jgi:hypothetical protein